MIAFEGHGPVRAGWARETIPVPLGDRALKQVPHPNVDGVRIG